MRWMYKSLSIRAILIVLSSTFVCLIGLEEIGWWRCPMDLVSTAFQWRRTIVLCRKRYIGIEERILWESREVQQPQFGGTYDVQTHNALFGLQFGGDYKWETKSWSRWSDGQGGSLSELCRHAQEH